MALVDVRIAILISIPLGRHPSVSVYVCTDAFSLLLSPPSLYTCVNNVRVCMTAKGVIYRSIYYKIMLHSLVTVSNTCSTMI